MPREHYKVNKTPEEHPKPEKKVSHLWWFGSVLVVLFLVIIILLITWIVQNHKHAAHSPTHCPHEENYNVTVLGLQQGSEIETSRADRQTVETGSQEKIDCAGIDPVCENFNCKIKATHVLAQSNLGADPCKDIYEYSCGGLEWEGLTETSLKDNVFNTLIKQVKQINKNSPKAFQWWKDYYQSCINFEESTDKTKLDRLRAALWNQKWNFYNWTGDLTETVAQLLLLDKAPLFKVELEFETTSEGSRFVLAVFPPPEATLPKGSKTCTLPEDFQLRKITTVVEELEKCLDSQYDTLDISERALRDLQFFPQSTYQLLLVRDVAFLKATVPKTIAVNAELEFKNYNETCIEDLQMEFPQINWSKLLTMLTGSENSWDSTPVHLYMPEYFVKLSSYLKTAKNVPHSLIAMLVHDMYLNFYYTNRHQGSKRRKHCMWVTSELLPEVTSAVYLKSFPEDELNEIRDLISSTHKKLNTTVRDLWGKSQFDQESKDLMIEKLSTLIVVDDGARGIFLDEEYLDKRITQPEADYIDDTLSRLNFYHLNKYGMLGSSPLQPEYFATYNRQFDTKVKIYHELNMIVVPYGVVQLSELRDMPPYVQLSNLGFQIAKGIAGIYNPVGMLHDSDGQFYPKGVQRFEKGIPMYKANLEVLKFSYSFNRSQRFKAGFVEFKITNPTILVEKCTEDTALFFAYAAAEADESDNAWLKLPYLNMTSQQLFYVMAAQSACKKNPFDEYIPYLIKEAHLPTFIRVAQSLYDNEKFGRAFNCSPTFLPTLFDEDVANRGNIPKP